MFQQDGDIPNCSHKVESMTLSRVSWFSEALRVPFTNGLSQQSHPQPPSTKLHTWQNAVRQVAFSWQPPNPDPSIRWRNMICHSRNHVSTALESSCGMIYTTASDTLTALDDARLGCSWLDVETYSMQCSWANLKTTQVWGFVVIDSALQHLLMPPCEFTWPTTSWLNCIFVMKPRTAGVVAHVASYHGTKLEFTELLRMTNYLTSFCRSSLHAGAKAGYTCDHGSAWNICIQWLFFFYFFSPRCYITYTFPCCQNQCWHHCSICLPFSKQSASILHTLNLSALLHPLSHLCLLPFSASPSSLSAPSKPVASNSV